MNVRDCMSREVRLTSPDDTIQTAAQMMRDADTGALPVGENNRLVGMITDRDIALRAIAEGHGALTPVREVMTDEIECVFETDDIRAAADKMSELKVRRLAVVNVDKELVGILSLGDIARADSGRHGAEALLGISERGGPHTHH